MKKFAAVLFVFLATALARPVAAQMPEGPPGKWWKRPRIAQLLNLAPEQQAKLEGIFSRGAHCKEGRGSEEGLDGRGRAGGVAAQAAQGSDDDVPRAEGSPVGRAVAADPGPARRMAPRTPAGETRRGRGRTFPGRRRGIGRWPRAVPAAAAGPAAYGSACSGSLSLD